MKKVNKYVIKLITTVILIIAILCIYGKLVEGNILAMSCGFNTGMGTILGIYPAIFILFMVAGFMFAKQEKDRTEKQSGLFITLCITMLLFGIFHVDARKSNAFYIYYKWTIYI